MHVFVAIFHPVVLKRKPVYAESYACLFGKALFSGVLSVLLPL